MSNQIWKKSVEMNRNLSNIVKNIFKNLIIFGADYQADIHNRIEHQAPPFMID